jgi:DNA-binding SARP family transcriptional activator
VAPDVEFCLLGPLLVRRGDAPLPALPGKQRVLLAALLLRANCMVSWDELAEAMWGSEPPASARSTLRNYVKDLRKTLADGVGSRLSTVPGGYQMRVSAAELDLSKFEVLRTSAQVSASAGDWDRASEQLGAALSLWRGEPLADVPSERLASQEVPRLAEIRLQALEARTEADLRLGRHADVIAELRQLADAHPYRERLHSQLMLALYRNGQQAEALAAYQRVRDVLLERLGVEPGPELSLLQQQILGGDPALADSAQPRSRSAATPAAGGGTRLSGAAVPRQLPAAVRYFTGRSAELAALTSMLAGADGGNERTVVISAVAGTAGVGKTAAAVYWAHQAADRFPDGQLYVDLRGYDPGEPMPVVDALAGFLRALGRGNQDIPADVEERASLYRSILSGRRVLVVLDNARSAEQVRPLLPGAPGCAVLVTSRDALVGLVARDGAQRLDLDVLSVDEATELLRVLIGRRADADRGAVEELAVQCARLPLALRVAAELVAARPAVPLADLVNELGDQRGRLDLLNAGGDPRTAVRAVFSWSYQRLDADVARTFRLLGLHPGGDFEPYAVAALAGVGVDEARLLLDRLLGVYLIQPARTHRYGMHDLLKAYAAEQAGSRDREPDRRAALTRLLDYYLQTAHAAATLMNPGRYPLSLPPPQPGVTVPHLASRDDALTWFEAQHGALLAAIQRAADSGLGAHAWQLATLQAGFLCLRGYRPEWIAGLRTALAAAEGSGDALGQAHTLLELGGALLLVGRGQEADVQLRRALSLYRELGDRGGEARIHYYLSIVYERQDRYREALTHAQRALRVFRTAGQLPGQARALNNIGWYRAHLGEHREALIDCQQAVGLHREVADRRGEAASWDSLGFTHRQLGNYAESITCYRRAVDLYDEVGDRYQTAAARTHLGDVHEAAHNQRAAREAWQQALDVLDELGHPQAELIRFKLSAGVAAKPS